MYEQLSIDLQALGVCLLQHGKLTVSLATRLDLRFQESFTITLGAQMKQMHNIRLVAADPLQVRREDQVCHVGVASAEFYES